MIRRKWKLVLVGVVALLIAMRIALPIFMLKKANLFLADYSKVFTAHIGDIDLSFFRMAYALQDIDIKWRKDNADVLFVADVDVSLAWRELIRGSILTDVEITDARMKFDPDVVPNIKAVVAENKKKSEEKSPEEKQEAKEKAETIQSTFFPLRVERIVLKDSSFEFSAEKNAPEVKRLIFDQMQMRISNVSPLQADTKTVATFQSRLQRNANVKGVAQSRVAKNSFDWDLDLEMRDFNLVQANPFLLETVPFTFTSGTLDMFAEVKSENNNLIGYVKPFINKGDILSRKENFKSTKHFLMEIATALGNVIMKRSDLKSVATKLDFSKPAGGEFKVDALGALSNAVEHRTDRPIAPSIEDEILLK